MKSKTATIEQENT